MDELRTNAKHVSQAQQYEIRKNIVRLLKKGHKPSEVAAIVDVSRALVYMVKKAYDEKGIDGTCIPAYHNEALPGTGTPMSSYKDA